MRWKQFFTPVASFSADQAQAYLQKAAPGSYTLLDVRQPDEYTEQHLPGATLIPLPDLVKRLPEIDPGKPTIVYCAIGGRSRAAAQILSGKGFSQVYNLTGGIKAWNGQSARGAEDEGLALFTGAESVTDTLIIAYGLEEGLRDFYLSMRPRIRSETAREVFERLAAIEEKHKQRIFDAYQKAAGTNMHRRDFEKNISSRAMEGGLTTEQYLERYQPDLESPREIISLAMAIEAQALDLYQRAAARAETLESRHMLEQISAEENAHIEQLANLFGADLS